MNKGFVSKAEVTITAPVTKVWDALVSPEIIKQFMFGTDVVSDWMEGGPIRWRGEYQGKKYEDKGVILKLEPDRVLQYSHFSPLSGQPDVPENYHIVTMELSDRDTSTVLALSQDNNATEEEREHTAQFW